MAVPLGFPRQQVVTLRYVDYVTFPTDATGIPTYVTFRCNSIYDPYEGIGGHQPLMYDNWAALWRHYVVIGSKIQVTLSQDSDDIGSGIWGIYLTHTPSVMATLTPASLMEQGRTKWRQYQGSASAPKAGRISAGYSMKKFWSLANVKDNLGGYGAPFGEDPAFQAYWNIWNFCNPYGEGGSPVLSGTVVITFKVLLVQALDQTQN